MLFARDADGGGGVLICVIWTRGSARQASSLRWSGQSARASSPPATCRLTCLLDRSQRNRPHPEPRHGIVVRLLLIQKG